MRQILLTVDGHADGALDAAHGGDDQADDAVADVAVDGNGADVTISLFIVTNNVIDSVIHTRSLA